MLSESIAYATDADRDCAVNKEYCMVNKTKCIRISDLN